MIYPSADTIEQRVGSRYTLVVLTAKRAKQIKEGAPILIETTSTNPITIALEEIAAGMVTAQAAELVVKPVVDDEVEAVEVDDLLTGPAARLLGAGIDPDDDNDDETFESDIAKTPKLHGTGDVAQD